MSRVRKPAYTRRPRVENGGLALFLGLFVLLGVVLPSATGISATKWSVILLYAATGWKLRRQLKAALPTRKQVASFKPAKSRLRALSSDAGTYLATEERDARISAFPEVPPTANSTNGSLQ